ncbi:GSCOCG00001619001-RA-CDS [Cotesia congregata]|nr:GSCOCG00001619001-RA-CDS [Cotesia congregata]
MNGEGTKETFTPIARKYRESRAKPGSQYRAQLGCWGAPAGGGGGGGKGRSDGQRPDEEEENEEDEDEVMVIEKENEDEAKQMLKMKMASAGTPWNSLPLGGHPLSHPSVPTRTHIYIYICIKYILHYIQIQTHIRSRASSRSGRWYRDRERTHETVQPRLCLGVRSLARFCSSSSSTSTCTWDTHACSPCVSHSFSWGGMRGRAKGARAGAGAGGGGLLMVKVVVVVVNQSHRR